MEMFLFVKSTYVCKPLKTTGEMNTAQNTVMSTVQHAHNHHQNASEPWTVSM